ncbi:MAG: exo-alpha-sialidase [Planctomycetes bacterium]|nr:exo-alpha-sialidase [Planctomycetota bacterium]
MALAFVLPILLQALPGNVSDSLRLNGDTGNQIQNSIHIAINPTDRSNFLATSADFRSGNPALGHYASFDGGKSIAVDGTLNLSGYRYAQWPSVDFDGFGHAYIVGLHSTYGNAIMVHITRNGGRSFLPPLTVHKVVGEFASSPFVAVDQRTSGTHARSIYITYGTSDLITRQTVMLVHSRTGGVSWSTPIVVDSLPYDRGYAQSHAVGPNGELYVSWIHGKSVYLRASTDGGNTFGPRRVLGAIAPIQNVMPPTAFPCWSYTRTAVDRSAGRYRGRVHVCWASIIGGSTDIFATYSDDGGANWSTPQIVNDGRSNYQFMQDIDVDEFGTTYCSWLDRRNAPHKHECFASVSYDGGTTWSSNRLVSDTSNDPGPTTMMGAYCGIAASQGRAFATWVDYRSGTQDAYCAALQTDLEYAPDTIRASTGGTITMPVRAGSAHRGATYFLLASFGTNAGYPVGTSTFFLDIDPLMALSAGAPNSAMFSKTLGTLDAQGFASPAPSFVAPPSVLTPLVGRSISFGYLLFRGTNIIYGSNPVTVGVVN